MLLQKHTHICRKYWGFRDGGRSVKKASHPLCEEVVRRTVRVVAVDPEKVVHGVHTLWGKGVWCWSAVAVSRTELSDVLEPQRGRVVEELWRTATESSVISDRNSPAESVPTCVNAVRASYNMTTASACAC